MKIYSAIVAAFMAVVIGVPAVVAQNTMSPYSKFGYGLLNDNATSMQRQMGGVGYAMNSGRQINVMNPASYAYLDSLTFLFDMGVNFSLLQSREDTVKHTRKGGGLDYITLQFPIMKNVGASLGILPYSSVGYSFGSEIENGTDAHEGTGGLNMLYFGIGAKPFGGFSLGANISYLFGTTYNNIYVYPSTGSTSLFQQEIEVRDWHLDLGMQYSFRIGRKNRFTLGATFTPGKTLLGHAQVVKYDVGANDTPDTLSRVSLHNRFSLPDAWGAGICYEWDERLTIEADYSLQQWSKAKFAKMDDFAATKFEDRWRAAVGVQYVPKVRGNYVQRMAYRAGAFMTHDYMKVGTNSVEEYGITCGLGLPNVNTKTVINIGFEYRHRQATPNPLLKENYFNITLGINFNELWFFKNKIN